MDVTAFAEGEEDVIDEDHAEEDEDGAGDAADGAAAGVGDAEGGGDEGEDEALEGEGEAVVEMGAEGVEFGVGAVFVGDEVGDEVWDAHEVRGEGGGDDAPGGFGDAEDVDFGRGARESAGEVGEGGGFAVGVLDFLTLVEAPLVSGGPPHGAAGDPGALKLALFIFLTDFDVADFFLAKIEGEGADVPGAAGFGVMKEEGVGENGASLAAGEGAHDGLAVAFGAGGPVVVGGEGDEGSGEGGEEDGSEDLGDAATGAELGDDLVGAGHFGEGVENAEEDGGWGDGDEDEGDEMQVKEEHFADRSFGILEVFEAVEEVHEDVEGAEGDEAEEGGAEEVAKGILVEEAGVGVDVEADGWDEAGEADHDEFDEIGGGGGGFASEGDDGGFEMGGEVGRYGPGGAEEAGNPDGADHAASVGPGAEEGEMEDDPADQEPHFEIG